MARKRPDGDGLVRKRKDGRWEGRIVIGHKEDGTPIYKSVFAKTQKELMPKLHGAIDCYRDADLSEQGNMTLSEWIEKWLTSYAEPTLRESTIRGYRSDVRHHIKPALGNKMLRSITQRDVQKFYNALGRKTYKASDGNERRLADATVRGVHMLLHEIMEAAVRSRLIVMNPTDGTVIPKLNRPPMKILNEEQLDKFMKAIRAEPLWYDFFYTEITTGLRRGEICGLKWCDLDETNGTLKICRSIHSAPGGALEVGNPKTEKGTRTILLPPSTLHVLKERRKMALTEWIFPSLLEPEKPTAPSAAYHRLKVILKAAGLPDIRFHDLRHPYVKHTTKIFSLRLMDFQAQAYPDARRKTRGACQLLRVGQSRSPVRPLCNRKRFSCLPPQSKMSWILYAISMRLSGYTSTRSISSSASSVVSVSASKIALDASFRLSCRACSSCFCFACANTAA